MKAAIGVVIACAVLLGGCSGLMGSLRKDLDDSDSQAPGGTSGGVWSERGLLEEDQRATSRGQASLGHSERRIASQAANDDAAVRGGSWVSGANAEANRRDRYRDSNGDENADPAYSNNPSVPPDSRRAYKNGGRATREDFIDEDRNDGSLWGSDGQANFFFTKNKIRSPGDIITIVSEADLVRDIGSEIQRTLTSGERDEEVELAQARANPAKGDAVASSSAAPSRSPAGASKTDKAEPEAKKATAADIDVTKSMGFKAGDPILAEIVERYPNGNYKVRGSKKVPYRGSFRYVSMLAIVRGQDVADDDTVPSGKMYEYRVEAVR